MESYRLGYREGYQDGVISGGTPMGATGKARLVKEEIAVNLLNPKPKRRVKRSSKAKLLDKMTKPVWDRYKKGRGKKTYVQIRAQVSRSQKYKRAVKRL